MTGTVSHIIPHGSGTPSLPMRSVYFTRICDVSKQEARTLVTHVNLRQEFPQSRWRGLLWKQLNGKGGELFITNISVTYEDEVEE